MEPPLKRRALSALRDHEAALVLAPEEAAGAVEVLAQDPRKGYIYTRVK